MININVVHTMMRLVSREEVGRKCRDKAVLVSSFCIKRIQSILSKYDGPKLHFDTVVGFIKVIKKEKQNKN